MKKIDAHGADLYALTHTYHLRPEDISDFSSNINPLGPSPKALETLKHHLDAARVYPDPHYRDLKEAISSYLGVKDAPLLLGNGTSQLIADAIETIAPKKAMVNVPCYSEYENELRRIGADIVHLPLLPEEDFAFDVDRAIDLIEKESIDLYVITNPNNPTGTLISLEDLLRLLEETEVVLLVDETYVEFVGQEASAIPLALSHPRILVLRSTSKFFASPGLRLGYGVTSDEALFSSIENASRLWGLSIYADLMGQAMFRDVSYQEEVLTLVKTEREKALKRLGTSPHLRPLPSFGNFILTEILGPVSAKELREALLPKGLVIRDCASFGLGSQFFRFCILSPEENARLLADIFAFMEKECP